MAILNFVFPASGAGSWSDPNCWQGDTYPHAPPTADDDAIVVLGSSETQESLAALGLKVLVDVDISVKSLYVEIGTLYKHSTSEVPKAYKVPITFDLNGHNLTAVNDVTFKTCDLIGMSGTTWTVGGAMVIYANYIYNADGTYNMTDSFNSRPFSMTATWNICSPSAFCTITGSTLQNISACCGHSIPVAGLGSYSPTITNCYNLTYGSVSQGDCPIIPCELLGAGFLEGDIDLNNLYLFRIDGELLGAGFLEGDMDVTAYVEHLDGELLGAGFLEGSLTTSMNLTTSISGELLGAGFLEGIPRFTYALGVTTGGSGGSQAGVSAGYACRISTLGPLDWLDQTKFKLTVGNTVVDFSQPYWKPESIQVDYNGKTFTFTEIATPNFSRPSFNNETAVTLQMDLGSGLQTFFRGKIKNRVHHGEIHNEAIQYTAFGQQNLAAELDDYGPWGITDDSFLGPWPVGTVIQRIFSNNATNLANNSISATIGVPDTSTFSTWTIQELSLRNSQLLSGLTQALKTEPSKRIFFDDLQGDSGKWCFPDLATSNFVDLDIDLVNVDPNDFTVDTRNRWTAIKVYVPFELSVDGEQTGMIEMVPGWDASYEADWNIRKGMGLAGAEVLGDAYRWVFRRWTFDTGNIQTETGGPITAVFLVPYWNTTRWIPIQGDLDLANGVFIAKVPLICKGNPHRTSSPKIGPYAAALLYVDTETQPLPAVAWQRIPATGYTGTAYSWFGVQREKQLIVEPNAFAPFQSLEAYAQRKLDVLKDVILTTEFPVAGDPIPELINLQAQVIIKDSSRGLESVPGFLSKYTYTFGKPGKSVLSLSTDRSLVTRTD